MKLDPHWSFLDTCLFYKYFLTSNIYLLYFLSLQNLSKFLIWRGTSGHIQTLSIYNVYTAFHGICIEGANNSPSCEFNLLQRICGQRNTSHTQEPFFFLFCFFSFISLTLAVSNPLCQVWYFFNRIHGKIWVQHKGQTGQCNSDRWP